MSHRFLLVALAAAVLLAGCAQTPGDLSPAASGSSAGGVSGHVLRSDGAPMPGVKVQAEGRTYAWKIEATSDASGAYKLDSPGAGDYDVSALADVTLGGEAYRLNVQPIAGSSASYGNGAGGVTEFRLAWSSPNDMEGAIWYGHDQQTGTLPPSPSGAKIVLRFAPESAFADGTTGAPIEVATATLESVREFHKVGDYAGIPIGRFTVTALWRFPDHDEPASVGYVIQSDGDASYGDNAPSVTLQPQALAESWGGVGPVNFYVGPPGSA